MSWPCGWTRAARRHGRRAGRRGLLPIEADPAAARRALGRVPLWFHTFALNREHGLYTPGVARDHRSRVPFVPLSFAGERVLDVGTFDGFYAFLAEHRGAAHVLVDNEQYVAWVRARWGIELQGGEGFATIAELLGSRVQHRRGDALALDGPPERFDVVLCFGILHRVENPLGLLRRLAALLAPGGRLLVETYGIASDGRVDAHDRGPATGRRLRRRRLRLLGLRRGRTGRDRPAGRPGRDARRRHRRPRLAPADHRDTDAGEDAGRLTSTVRAPEAVQTRRPGFVDCCLRGRLLHKSPTDPVRRSVMDDLCSARPKMAHKWDENLVRATNHDTSPTS